MGLHVTYDCWSGSYSSFNTWRHKIASVINLDLDNMAGYGGSVRWGKLKPDVIHVLLDHSDCEGEIQNYWLEDLAERLEEILEIYKKNSNSNKEDSEWFVNKTQRFIDGLKDADASGDSIIFC